MRVGVAVMLAAAGWLGVVSAQTKAPAPASPHPGLVRVVTDTPEQRADWEKRLTAMVRAGTLKVREQREAGTSRDQWLVQLHKGVPVHGTEVWRRLEGAALVSAEGVLYERIRIDPVPSMTRAEAREAVLALAPGTLGPSRPPALVVLPTPEGRYVLAYRAAVFDGVDLVVHFLDASSGKVVLSEKAALPPPAAGR
jgi:hypothetical protein